MGFSEQLKKARLNKNYTQQQVADLMKITKSTYCGYETGKRQPDVAKIKQLASILNTSGDILLETGFEQTNGNTEIFQSPTTDALDLLVEKYDLSDGDYVLIQNFVNLRPEVRKNILEYCLKVAADISKNEDDYIPLTQTRMTTILQSLPKTPEELERQFPPVEFKRKKSDAG